MPLLRNSKHELFAQHIASGHNQSKAYVLAGYAPAAAMTGGSKLVRIPKIAARIEEIKLQIIEKIQAFSIKETGERLARQQLRYDKMHQVIDERAVDPTMQEVAGGKTGLLVRKMKSVGSGDSAQLVEEFEVDTALLSEIRRHEEHAARELGQWAEPGSGSTIQIAVMLPSTQQQSANQTQALPTTAAETVLDVTTIRRR